MSKRFIAAVVITGFAILLAVQFRAANRADAAGGDCYSDSKGPSEPTICN